MRMCYPVDFGPAGKLKREGGSLRAIRHNCRIPRLAGTDAQDGANSDVEACRGQERPAVLEAEMTWKENIDPLRNGLDQFGFTPAYGHGNGSWVSPHDLPAALNAEPERTVMDALQGLLGIEDVDGALRYSEGKGDCGGCRPKPDAKDKSKWRRKARKAVMHDAVLSVDVILQASPSFFFPKIREEEGAQERIAKSLFWERGELDQGAVIAFREAGLAWAKDRWGEERIAEMTLHLDESCPHMHILLVLGQNGWLNAAGGIVAGPAETRAMLDAMEPLLINGKPPALPGDSQSLTFREVSREAPFGLPRKCLKRQTKNGRRRLGTAKVAQKEPTV